MLGFSVDPEKEMLYSVIHTPDPTPVTGHLHFILVVQELSTGLLKLNSVVAHPSQGLQKALATYTVAEYETFLKDWIEKSPYQYKVIDVKSNDMNKIGEILQRELKAVMVFGGGGKGKKSQRRDNPFLKGFGADENQ